MVDRKRMDEAMTGQSRTTGNPVPLHLPEWSTVSQELSDGAPLNPLERFIYENEPAELGQADEFRRQLSDMIEWVRGQ